MNYGQRSSSTAIVFTSRSLFWTHSRRPRFPRPLWLCLPRSRGRIPFFSLAPGKRMRSGTYSKSDVHHDISVYSRSYGVLASDSRG